MGNLDTIIYADEVPVQHYFMEALDTDIIIWAIRIAGIFLFILIMVIYWRMRRKNKG